MKRAWFLLLALSVGLNGGLIYEKLSGRSDGPGPGMGTPRETGPRLGPRFHPDGPPGFIRDRMGRIGTRLGLTDAQREEMASVLGEKMPALIEQRRKVDEARNALRKEYLRGNIDEAGVRAQVHLINQSQSRLDSLVVETMLGEVSVLNPEQRAAYLEMMPWDRGPHGPGKGGRGFAGRGFGRDPGKR